MSANKDNFDSQARTVASNGSAQQKKTITVSKENVVEVAKRHSVKDYLLWLLAVVALIGATLVSDYLPRYWVMANDVWVQLACTASLIIFAIICLVFTHQGRAFKTLLKDAGIELRRVTWPTKDETIRYTWQTILMIIIFGVVVWVLDNIFNKIIGFVLN
ncbi:preprotein translocase subunit SecE [Moraxella sp. Tifton1]|uniref:Protein translocase subunit SecE n=1 Tax=Moraxella oculi TaxID=2940516 RepID=A0ABW8U5Z4_9GAMM|nr:preprotein translocase subunit SecE [Moraxella sp. Tifton1]MCL1624151.1 preprotein translocase subunit SecE [Moraxella sp. Tifton1]